MTAPESAELVHHRLQLPSGTRPEDVLTMVRNRVPDAELSGDAIALPGGARLRHDPSPRRDGRWQVEVPRDREGDAAPELPDMRGYGRAFAEGLPFGVERETLDLAWSLARRFHGAILTQEGCRLEPHPAHVRDLHVVTVVACTSEELTTVLRKTEPTAQADARVGAAADGTAEGAAAGEDGAPEAPLYARATIAAGDDEIEVRMAPVDLVPPALAAVPWVAQAVVYEIHHLSIDDTEPEVEQPESELSARWLDLYGRIGRIAGLLGEQLGGFVLDGEGFLVDPADLS